ncbi:MAG: orotidine-5'-phosphate decarboxylase [Aquificaceae bacterium]
MPKLCIALDTSIAQALELIDGLRGYPVVFKVGYRLFISHHRNIVDAVKEAGFELFLDLKLNDIPNTMREATVSVKDLGADYLTLHTLAGFSALRECVQVKSRLKLIGVTVLTSLSEEDMEEIGLCQDSKRFLATLAQRAGLDGIVCSGKELEEFKDINLMKVVAGVRLSEDSPHDQKRVVSLEEAINLGADMIVMGRSILLSQSPIKTIDKILMTIS